MSRKVSTHARSSVAFKLEQEIKDLKGSIGRNIWDLARNLKTFRDKEYYTDLGHQTITEWLNSPDIDISERWAYAYMDMHEQYIERLGYNSPEFMATDYTKLYRILPIIKQMPDDKAKEWTDKAIQLRRIDLQREIQQHRLDVKMGTLKEVMEMPARRELIFGSPLVELPKVSDKTADAVITAPIHLAKAEMQFMVAATGNVPEQVIYHQARVQYHERWLKETYRVLKETGSLLAVVDHRDLIAVGHAMRMVGFHVIRDIVWKHSPSKPVLVNEMMMNHHSILWGVKGNDFFHTQVDTYPDIWDFDFKPQFEVEGDLPPQLVQEMVRLVTTKGMSVIDPFASAGTVVSVASRMGRSSLGIEAGAEAYKIASDRLEAEKPKITVSIA